VRERSLGKFEHFGALFAVGFHVVDDVVQHEGLCAGGGIVQSKREFKRFAFMYDIAHDGEAFELSHQAHHNPSSSSASGLPCLMRVRKACLTIQRVPSLSDLA
jgi:hypothetical protein